MLPTILQADSIDTIPTGKAFYMVLADEVSSAYSISAPMVKSVLKNESDFNPMAVGDHGLAKNVAQFHKTTFDMYEIKYFKATGNHLNYDSGEDQVKLLCWMWKTDPSTKNLWSTYRRLYGVQLKGTQIKK